MVVGMVVKVALKKVEEYVLEKPGSVLWAICQCNGMEWKMGQNLSHFHDPADGSSSR